MFAVERGLVLGPELFHREHTLADDIASAVAYVSADDAGYLTGQVICVDGGMAM